MGPLAGKRIIEFGGIGPGPFCGMLLADMGAEVIVIERKQNSSGESGLPPDLKFALLNRGKKSIALDLKQAAARDVILRLLADADGLIEGFRPGVMERLGIGPEACLAANPGLVYGRMTGWGQTGPLSQAAGHDLNYIALSGALYYGGRADSVPSAPPTIVGDVCGGALMLAVGMLAALVNVQETGRGQVVDAAITDGAALSTMLLYNMFKQGYWNSGRQQNFLDGGAHWYDCYECADGKFVSIGSLEPKFYTQLLDKLGLADDPEFSSQFDSDRWPEQKQRFAEVFRARTREEWCDLLEGSDVCFAPVLDFDEAPKHPHNRERGTFTSIASVTQPAPAPRFSETVSEVSGPGPAQGQHTDEILALAGYSNAEREAMRDSALI
jgi:alpha-methylacyl-CoA racemase